MNQQSLALQSGLSVPDEGWGMQRRPGTPSLLRELNDRSALELLLRHIEITTMTTEATATTGRTDMGKTPAIMVPAIMVPDIAQVIVIEVGHFFDQPGV